MDLMIERLGHRGDGIARVEGRSIFVPGVLPGELVRADVVKDRAQNVEILTASQDRTQPVCRHYGSCGGCSLQHLSAQARADFAVLQLTETLKDRGISAEIAPAVMVPLHSRRRATFAGLRIGARTLVGFHTKESHQIVQLEDCAVVVPEIFAAMPAFHELAKAAAPKKGPLDIQVTATRGGLDVVLHHVAAKEIERLRLPLTELAARHNFARLSIGDETVIERALPLLTIAGMDVVPPPGGFLQASETAERAMGALVVELAGKGKTALDLFSGCGTFAYYLAQQMRVHAVEGDASAVKALDRAARFGRTPKPITVEKRDLFYRPMLPVELNAHDVVVFDPPRAGALEQCERLAKSQVKRIIAISCNPATFARDARVLIDGGYHLEKITPVLQFLFSNHLELIALFERG